MSIFRIPLLPFFTFVLVSIMIISCDKGESGWTTTASNSKIDANFNSDLKNYFNYYESGDAKNLVGSMNPEMIEHLKIIANTNYEGLVLQYDGLLRSMHETSLDLGNVFTFEHYNIKHRYRVNDLLVYTTDYYVLANSIKSPNQNNWIFGISRDKGDSWKFNEISSELLTAYKTTFEEEDIKKYLLSEIERSGN